MTSEAWKDEIIKEGERMDLIHAAVTAALDVLDEAYPEFKKSEGPFGDELAGKLDRVITEAFSKHDTEQEKEYQLYMSLRRKYER